MQGCLIFSSWTSKNIVRIIFAWVIFLLEKGLLKQRRKDSSSKRKQQQHNNSNNTKEKLIPPILLLGASEFLSEIFAWLSPRIFSFIGVIFWFVQTSYTLFPLEKDDVISFLGQLYSYRDVQSWRLVSFTVSVEGAVHSSLNSICDTKPSSFVAWSESVWFHLWVFFVVGRRGYTR